MQTISGSGERHAEENHHLLSLDNGKTKFLQTFLKLECFDSSELAAYQTPVFTEKIFVVFNCVLVYSHLLLIR